MRLDRALVDRGLAESRTKAAAMITAGEVGVNGMTCRRPARPVTAADRIVVVGRRRYVSRAGEKLVGALDDLGVAVAGVGLDAGASTGGFTEVLLERGCREVHAVDVGHGQLHPRIAADARVRNHEGLNLRHLRPGQLTDLPVDVVVADVSFISLTLVLAPLLACAAPDAVAVLMVKPQFEVGRAGLDRHGVVSDPRAREQAIEQVSAAATTLGWVTRGRCVSRLPGESGNVEEFLHLRRADVGTERLGP